MSKEFFSYDLHLHSRKSKDAISAPRNICKFAQKKSLTGLTLSDHDTCAGWKEMKVACKEFKLEFIPGIEITSQKEGKANGEILCLFLNEPIIQKDIFEVIDLVHEQDGLIVAQHPIQPWYQNRKSVKNISEIVKDIDAIEAMNGHYFSEKYNKACFAFAQKLNKPITGGSDAHSPGEVGNVKTLSPSDDAEGLRKSILKKQTQVEGNVSGLFQHFNTWRARLGLKERD